MLMRRVVSLGGSVFIGVLATLALGSIGSAQTEDTAKGASLLAEARKALGGDDKLAAVKRLQVKGEMRRGQGNNTLEGDTEVFLELPDKFRRNESLSIGPGLGGIDRVEVLNGNEIWDQNSGGAAIWNFCRNRGASGKVEAAYAADAQIPIALRVFESGDMGDAAADEMNSTLAAGVNGQGSEIE